MAKSLNPRIKAAWQGSEFSLHKFTIELLHLTAKPSVLFFHCPNGEYRSPRTGARLKAMGVRRGVADIVIIVKGVVHFLELKNGAGRQSADQLAFETDAVLAGARYMVARSPEAVRNILEIWRAIEPPSSLSPARRAAA